MEAIKKFRARKSLSRAALAEKLNVAPHTIFRWEHGDRTPALGMLGKIAEALGVTEAELLNGPEDEGEVKFSFVLNIREVESMDVKMNEVKCGSGEEDIFGLFRFSKNQDVEVIGARFVNFLRAELAGDKVKREELARLERVVGA